MVEKKSILLSQWEWLEEACKEQGLKRSAELARKIEELLKLIYKDTSTYAWKEDRSNFSMDSAEDILEVALTYRYCTACETYCSNCRTRCAFAAMGGICDEHSSLYAQFIRTLFKEWRK